MTGCAAVSSPANDSNPCPPKPNHSTYTGASDCLWSCNEDYYLVDHADDAVNSSDLRQAENSVASGRFSQLACIPCKALTCPSGEYRTGCGGGATGSCESCRRCADGEYLVGCGENVSGQCLRCGNSTWKPCASDEDCRFAGCCAMSGDYRCATEPSDDSRGESSSGTGFGYCSQRAGKVCCRGWGGISGESDSCDLGICPYYQPSACPLDQYLSGCRGADPGACAPCTSTCTTGYYLLGCGGVSSGSCVQCSNCTSGHYRIGCGGTSLGSCVECPTCQRGQYSSGCIGTFTGSCLPCTPCPSGLYRAGCDCEPCPVGTYPAAGLTLG